MKTTRNAATTAALLLLLAPPLPAQQARAEKPVAFAVGETLTYDVSWTSYVTAGTVTATVKEKPSSPGSRAYHIVAEGRPVPLLAKMYNLYYRIETWLDASSLLPERGVIYSEEGSRQRTRTTRFDHAAKKVEYEVRIGTAVKRSFPIPALSQDALSALYVARSLGLKGGDALTIPVADGGRVYRVRLAVGAREQVAGPGGRAVPAWRVTPQIVEGGGDSRLSASFWLSDDPRRLPLKLEIAAPVGKFLLTLRDVKP